VSQSGAGAGRREVAWRLFATEFDDATYSYSEGDEERAPNYVITPTGARVNRVFVVGVLTEVEPVTDEVVRARVVDPTGAFVVYAGQYQPDALAFLERADQVGTQHAAHRALVPAARGDFQYLERCLAGRVLHQCVSSVLARVGPITLECSLTIDRNKINRIIETILFL